MAAKNDPIASAPTHDPLATEVSSTALGAKAAANSFVPFLATIAIDPAPGAQQPAMPVIGFLHGLSPNAIGHQLEGFHQGLKESGYVEDQNVAIKFRWADGQYDRLPALATDLVRLRVNVIAAGGGAVTAAAARAATATIPIIFTNGDDPIRAGLVASLNRPSGNLTGVSFLAAELAAKWLELLHELVPSAATIGVLLNPKNATAEAALKDAQEAARALGKQIVILNVSAETDLEPAFATLIQRRAEAITVGTDPFFADQRERLATLAARYRIPAIYSLREYAEAGGLMSYGASIKGAYRQAGTYVGRILKGDKPADLPVVQPTKFEFVINLKAAKALGLTIPQSLLATADEVIE
jgi:putative tryptophan/tyrosine transport system substrate-binding protein